MLSIDTWKEIWTTLRANRVRTGLTAFGVFWGIVMLMAMLAFSSSIRSGAERQLEGMATNLLFVWGQQTSKPHDGLQPGRRIEFTKEDIELLRRLPGVEWLAPRQQLGGRFYNAIVSNGSTSSTYRVMGDYPQFEHIMAFVYEQGRFLNDRDIADARKVVVIGRAVRDQLFGKGVDPTGKYVQISGVYFQVVGVVRTLRSGPSGELDANTVHAPFTALDAAFNMQSKIGLFALTAKPGIDGAALEARVRAVLGNHHRIAPGDDSAIGSNNMFAKFAEFQSFLAVLAILSWVVGSATLLAGVIGVSNIMLITVKERTKEIGVRKALGAKRRAIVSLVVMESAVLTLAAGLIGVATGVAILILADEALLAFAADSPLGPPHISLQSASIAVGVLVGAGVVAGIIPAFHAASIKPIEALRAE